jgi:hypothetical protein
MEEVEEAKKAENFDEAKTLLTLLREMKSKQPKTTGLPDPPEDPYIIQQLALVTYKAKEATPEEIATLREASDLLSQLNPQRPTIPKRSVCGERCTSGFGTKQKTRLPSTRRYAVTNEGSHSNDYYNGINFAFLLNIWADLGTASAKASVTPKEFIRQLATAIADFVQAELVREEVLTICDEWIKSSSVPDEKASDEARKQYRNRSEYFGDLRDRNLNYPHWQFEPVKYDKFWILITKAEAYLGNGENGIGRGGLPGSACTCPPVLYDQKRAGAAKKA